MGGCEGRDESGADGAAPGPVGEGRRVVPGHDPGGCAQGLEGAPGGADLDGHALGDRARVDQALDGSRADLRQELPGGVEDARDVALEHRVLRLELLRLAVNEARLDQAPIDRVVSQLVASLKRELKEPDAVASRMFRAAAFPGHAYGRAARGEIDSLGAIARDDLLAMRGRMLARDNLFIAVVGAIDAKTLAAKLDATFGALPERASLLAVPPAVMQGVGERLVTDIDVPQATIRFGRPGVERDDPDFMAAVVVNHILGGGAFTARLFREVREKRGLAYSVYSHLQNYDHAALVVGATSTKNERAKESLDVIEEQIRDLVASGPTEEELAKARKFLIGSYALRFDTSTKIAGNLLQLQLEGRKTAYLDQRNRLVAAVDLEAAKRAAKKLLGDGRLLVALAGRPTGM